MNSSLDLRRIRSDNGFSGKYVSVPYIAGTCLFENYYCGLFQVAEKRKKVEKIIGFLDFILHEISLLCYRQIFFLFLLSRFFCYLLINLTKYGFCKKSLRQNATLNS